MLSQTLRGARVAAAVWRQPLLAPVTIRGAKKKASSKGAATPEPPAGAAAAAAAAAATAVELLDLRDVESRMQRSLQRLKSDLSTVSAARADPRMFDSVTVDAYGSSTPLGSVAQVSAKSANMLHVSVFDPTLVQAVRQAIVEQDLGLNPVSDGNTLKVPIPKMTAETRESLVKLVNKHAEKAKQAIRKVRHDGMVQLKAAKDNVSEDDVFRQSSELQKITDAVVKQITDVVNAKADDLRSS